MEDSSDILKKLKAELELRKMVVTVSLANPRYAFYAVHPVYSKNPIRIWVFAKSSDCIKIIVGDMDDFLRQDVQKEIMRKYMEYFDTVKPEGAVSLTLHLPMQANRDLGEIVNILIRAYGLGVTS